jgi:hypothetical protein
MGRIHYAPVGERQGIASATHRPPGTIRLQALELTMNQSGVCGCFASRRLQVYAARILFRAGAPLDRAVLVTTSPGQSAYIESEIFKTRNQDELGYQPMTARKRLSAADLEMSPSIASLQADPRDPLDP